MKGLVLAGGAGQRLRPLTHTGAKQLVPVANRPVIFYVIDNLVRAEVRDIGIIIAPETGAEITGALGTGERFGACFTFIEQPHPGGLAHALRCAQPYLGDDVFVMYLGDNLVGAELGDMARAFAASPEVAVGALLKEVDNPSAFGVATVDADGRVTGLIEKPAAPESNLALVGVYFFRPSIFAAIDCIEPSWRGELEITDAISVLIRRGELCRFHRLESWWLDTGKKDDLLLANDTVLDHWLEPAVLGRVDAQSRVSGRVRIEPGATIERSSIRGPAIIGRDARVIDATIGPFTAIGDHVEIRSSRVEHSIILEGSHISGVARLEDSVLGRRVRVRVAADRAGGLTLMVGDDCVIEPGHGPW
jgi:glucose-1-phosphate thymidylyltransferase